MGLADAALSQADGSAEQENNARTTREVSRFQEDCSAYGD